MDLDTETGKELPRIMRLLAEALVASLGNQGDLDVNERRLKELHNRFEFRVPPIEPLLAEIEADPTGIFWG